MRFHGTARVVCGAVWGSLLLLGAGDVAADDLFSVIVPSIMEYRTTNSEAIIHTSGGWLVSTKTNIDLECLTNAVFHSSFDQPFLQAWDDFLSAFNVAPMPPGRVAGYRSTNTNAQAFDPLLQPGEALYRPNMGFWSRGVGFPLGYVGTNRISCIVVISNEYAAFTAEYRFTHSEGKLVAILEGQRVSSRTIPARPVFTRISQGADFTSLAISNLATTYMYSIEQSGAGTDSWTWVTAFMASNATEDVQIPPDTGSTQVIYRTTLGL